MGDGEGSRKVGRSDVREYELLKPDKLGGDLIQSRERGVLMCRAGYVVQGCPVKAEPTKLREIREQMKELGVVYARWGARDGNVQSSKTVCKSVCDGRENVDETVSDASTLDVVQRSGIHWDSSYPLGDILNPELVDDTKGVNIADDAGKACHEVFVFKVIGKDDLDGVEAGSVLLSSEETSALQDIAF